MRRGRPAMRLAARWGALRDVRSLGAQLVLVLTGVGVAGAVAITLLLAGIITPSFNALERRAVDGHVDRTRAVLGEYAAKVENAVRDYGDWTASYDYMARPSAAFEQESFSPLAMTNLGVQGMAYVAPGGRVLIARWLDPATGAESPEMRQRLLELVARLRPADVLKGQSSAHFFARLGPSVAALGIAQVRRSDGTGSPRGYVLMARVVTSAQVADLLQLDARIDRLGAGDAVEVTPGSTMTEIAVPIDGVDGHAVAATRFRVPRDVSVLGRRMWLLAVAGSTVLLLLVLVVLRRLIGGLVLRPLNRMEDHIQRVRASGSLVPLADDGRRDEFGSLRLSFNAMLAQLKDLREQIEVQSFALGRSESAVAVMHNVRNALSPVSTILSQGIAAGAPVDRQMVERAVAELAREGVPAPRREKLAAFVAAALAAEGEAREAMRRELGIGREAMAHVLEIIGQQQAQAHERPALERCDVSEIIARNAAIARYSNAVSIAFSFPGDAHPVMANRVILSQVIGNLFGNAVEAIAATGATSGAITVSVRERGETVEVHIRDSGEGFDPERGPTLFQRGFSTRAHKSGGLGLHWCANSMTAMDGALRLESEGKGRGAVAILTMGAATMAAAA